jgi:hypothetical protein
VNVYIGGWVEVCDLSNEKSLFWDLDAVDIFGARFIFVGGARVAVQCGCTLL